MLRAVRGWLLVTLLCSGCSYPEFEFPAADTDVAIDTSSPVIDSRVDDADAALADTSVTDTGPPKVGCAAATHFFCADWESSTEPTYGWMGFYTEGGGTIAVDSTAFMSTRSFYAQVPGGGSTNAASLTRTFDAPTAASVARIDVHIRFDQITYGNDILLFKLQRDNHGASVWLRDKLYAEGFGATYRTYNIAKTIAPGVWYHFRLEASLKTSGAVLRVFIDDMATPLVDVKDASTAISEGIPRQLALGLFASMESTTPLTAFSARYDDVSLDWL